eukprot:TRINITY_DN115015_c0_g1_i1.p1 TRINITY_DN115015_c0_g1~~TRINITY_DN115015_c0_g1_i1.p1  ORF type:complete len:399 (+),score=83.08 TRINITY_DN115015_c0_g1_i1:80-1276(+)
MCALHQAAGASGAFVALPAAPVSERLVSASLRGQAATGAQKPATASGSWLSAAGSYLLPCAAVGMVGSCAAARLRSRRCKATASSCRPRATAVSRQAGFGPDSYDMRQRKDAISDEVGQRINSLIQENAKGLATQLDQYGFAQIDGFLGGSIFGTPDTMREEMRALFSRGWFEQESEDDAAFKVGYYKVTNQDRDNRFRAKMRGYTGEAAEEKAVETQNEVAPTVVQFTRGLLVSLASHIGKATGFKLSSTVGISEMICMAGNGARYDRRVNNVFGWNTSNGFAPDTRKLSVFYFTNPKWEEQFGGHLQLEGVITPTGGVSIAPANDRLVMFWSDKTVWSVRPVQSPTMQDFQFGVKMQLVVEDPKQIDYDPKRFQRWFPELQHIQMDWQPPQLPGQG